MDVGDPNWSICGALDCGSDNQVSDEKSEVLIQNCELGQEEQNSTDRHTQGKKHAQFAERSDARAKQMKLTFTKQVVSQEQELSRKITQAEAVFCALIADMNLERLVLGPFGTSVFLI